MSVWDTLKQTGPATTPAPQAAPAASWDMLTAGVEHDLINGPCVTPAVQAVKQAQAAVQANLFGQTLPAAVEPAQARVAARVPGAAATFSAFEGGHAVVLDPSRAPGAAAPFAALEGEPLVEARRAPMPDAAQASTGQVQLSGAQLLAMQEAPHAACEQSVLQQAALIEGVNIDDLRWEHTRSVLRILGEALLAAGKVLTGV